MRQIVQTRTMMFISFEYVFILKLTINQELLEKQKG